MNRFPTERLMTIEEAQQLSDPRMSVDAQEQRRQVWAWQSVACVMSQTISDEQLERMETLRLRK